MEDLREGPHHHSCPQALVNPISQDEVCKRTTVYKLPAVKGGYNARLGSRRLATFRVQV